MPLFMDIHDTTGATPEDIAGAHQKDLDLQEDFKCKFVYFWHDTPNCTGFCVFEAPDKEAVIKLHNKTHNPILPNQIIEVDLSEVEFFLGKITDIAWAKEKTPFDGYINETVHRAIMCLEIVNPLLLKLQDTKNKFADLSELQLKLIKDSFLMFEGHIVSSESDRILASFLSKEKAINCARDVQDKFIKLSTEENTKSGVSIGLNFGAPVTTSDNLFGETIKVAKQLAYFAGENQIIISSSLGKTYNRLRNKPGLKNGFIKVLNLRDETFLNELFETFEKNWNEEGFSINSLIKHFSMSRAQLYRKITFLTGYSPNNFIRETRLKNARKLIETQKGDIAEIAYESGFNSASYFSKCFRKKFGILPSMYAGSFV